MIRVVLPAHLKSLASITSEIEVDVTGPATWASILDAIETRYPMLAGTIRDRHTGQRRAYVRFYACEQDLSNDPPDTALPAEVVSGREPFIILGAMAGG